MLELGIWCFKNSFKIVNDGLLAGALENFFHKLEMRRMDLIRLLRRLAGKNQIQRDLIALLHDWARAGRHFADVKMQHAGNVFEQLVGGGHELVGGVRVVRVCPKDDDV